MLAAKQFEALTALMGAGRMSKPMADALRDYFCTTSPDAQKTIAARHGVSANGFNQRITHARRVIALACTLVVPPDET